MPRSFSRSPSPRRRRRSRSRSRSPMRRRSRSRSKERRPRYRSRSRERRRFSRERSPRRYRSRSRSRNRERYRGKERDRDGVVQKKITKPRYEERPPIEEKDLVGKSEEEVEMLKMMGFCGFDTSKGKKVQGNEVEEVHVILKRKYRQYMNRKGGFNRPLDFVA